MDSLCIMTGQQVCFHSAIKHANDVSNMVISKLWGFTVSWKKFKYCILCIVYTVFLFVKIENSNFIKEIKHVLRAFVAWWKSCENFLTGKNSKLHLRFSLLNSPECLPLFSPGYEDMEKMFYFLNEVQNYYFTFLNCSK